MTPSELLVKHHMHMVEVLLHYDATSPAWHTRHTQATDEYRQDLPELERAHASGGFTSSRHQLTYICLKYRWCQTDPDAMCTLGWYDQKSVEVEKVFLIFIALVATFSPFIGV